MRSCSGFEVGRLRLEAEVEGLGCMCSWSGGMPSTVHLSVTHEPRHVQTRPQALAEENTRF